MFKLYKHQEKQNKKTRKALKKHDHVLFGAATGFGKSVALWDLIKEDLEDGKRVLLLAPYRKLIFQLEETFSYQQPHVVMGTIDRGNERSGLILSSMDTMNSRLKKGSHYFDNIDKIYIDEAHISCNFPPQKNSRLANLYNMYWDSAKWVGFTATPITADGYRLEGWDKVIYKYQTPHLIEMGYLANFDYYAPVEVDLDKLRVSSTGDYVMEDIEEVTNTAVAIESVHNIWKKHGADKKVLIFGASIKHAELLKDAINGSMLIHSNMSDKQQMEILENFKNSTWGVLINVGILTTGFDDPSVEMLIIARPVKSERLYIQIAGRALRKYGDKKAVIYDMCSCYKNCGLPSDIRNFNKVKGEKKEREDGDEVQVRAIKCILCDVVSPRSEFTIKKKIKKKFILTKYWCPACGEMCKEDRVDLTEIKKMEKVNTKPFEKLNHDKRREIVEGLIAEFTKAKPSWSYFIVTTINKAGNSDFFDQEVAKGNKPKTLWKNIMKIFEESKNG